MSRLPVHIDNIKFSRQELEYLDDYLVIKKYKNRTRKSSAMVMERWEEPINTGTLNTKLTEDIRRMHESGSFSLGVGDKQGRTTIRRECKHFYHFLKGGNPALNNIRRESMFINLLQGLHPLEAEILCLVKDKRLTDKYNITREVVAEAYPDIVWGNRS